MVNSSDEPSSNELVDDLLHIASLLRDGVASVSELRQSLGAALGARRGRPSSFSGEAFPAEDSLAAGALGRLLSLMEDEMGRVAEPGGERSIDGEFVAPVEREDESVCALSLDIDPSIHDAPKERAGPGEMPDVPDGSPGTALAVPPLFPLPAGRYVVRKTLGTGGQGDVRELYDRSLRRKVALKTLRADLARNETSRISFLTEASLTAQLSHPCIVPIHDVGELSSGIPCYTMKRVRGRSLRTILAARRKGDPWAKEYGRERLLDIVRQVAHAVGYAHHRGVVHRDLKPANIMVGSYGQILVVDWGIAKVSDVTVQSPDGPVVPYDPTHCTRLGVVKGTPTYMAPEQARGMQAQVGPRTDVHALGLILYEVLTGSPARPIGEADEVLLAAREPVSVSPEQHRIAEQLPVRPIPEEIDNITMKCLQNVPEFRFPDGEAVAEALQSYLEGQKRRELAEKQALLAEEMAVKVAERRNAIARLEDEFHVVEEDVKPWDGTVSKRRLWAIEAALTQERRAYEEVMNRVIAGYTGALDHDPENARARGGLARLFFERLCQAERLGRVYDARQIEAQIRRYDDGQYVHELEGLGNLAVDTVPGGAEVWLCQYELMDRLLTPSSARFLGRAPVELSDVPLGSYVVIVRLKGGREVLYPVVIRRQARIVAIVRLHADLSPDFVQVTGGPFVYGGDRVAEGASSRQEISIDDFAIAKNQVTCEEYLRFLRSMPLETAKQHAPRTAKSQGGQLWWQVNAGRFEIPRRDEAGERWDPRYPIRCISRRDAEAFLLWRSLLDGIKYRLPTEQEWEKAARGVDARHYPWGDLFDATFCKMRYSRPGRAEPEPVGAFDADVSPYGLRDTAGGVSEWCSNNFDRFGLMGVLRGGHFRGEASTCRLARREAADPDEPAMYAGFRLARDVR